MYAPRLTKIFDYFAVGGPSTAPRPAASSTALTASPTPKKKKTKADDDADASDLSDPSTTGDSGSNSSRSSGEHGGDTTKTVSRSRASPAKSPTASERRGDGGRDRRYFPPGASQPRGATTNSSSARRRRPRQPGVRGKECRLSVREFVGMLRSLGVSGKGLGKKEAHGAQGVSSANAVHPSGDRRLRIKHGLP